MLQFPALMPQFPSPALIPSSVLLPHWGSAQTDDIFLAVEEAELEEKWNEIRKTNNDAIVIGKSTLDLKEEFDADAEDDDVDNVEESDGDEFEQETS